MKHVPVSDILAVGRTAQTRMVSVLARVDAPDSHLFRRYPDTLSIRDRLRRRVGISPKLRDARAPDADQTAHGRGGAAGTENSILERTTPQVGQRQRADGGDGKDRSEDAERQGDTAGR